MFTEPLNYLSSKLYCALFLIFEPLCMEYSELKLYIPVSKSPYGSLLCSHTTSDHIFLTCYFSELLTCMYNHR